MDQMFFGQDNKLDNILKAVWKISDFKQRLSMMSFALKKKIFLEAMCKTYRRRQGQFYVYVMILVRMIRDWAKPHSTDAFLGIVKGIDYVIVGPLVFLRSMCLSAPNSTYDHCHWYSSVHIWFVISIVKGM